MKKPKNSGVTVTPHPQPYSLLPSHQYDEFYVLPPDTQRFEEEEERKNAIIGNGHEEREEYQGDLNGEVEEDDEEEEDDDDEYEDDKGEEEEDGEERDGNGGVATSIEGTAIEGAATTTMLSKKLAEGFFEVEFIRKKRICKGERQYLIKWRGWPESANTWEPVDHLQTCPDVVEAFEKSLHSGQKKISRKRKRKRKFTQPKKKMQYPYGVSKKHGAVVKRPRAAKNIDGKGSETVSPCVAGNEKENGDQLCGQKFSGNLDMHFQQPMTIEGDGLENCQSNANCVEGGQSNQRRGARRRKSGSVRRFAQDMTSLSFDYFANSAPVSISSCDRAEELMGNSDGYRKKKFDSSRSSTVITRIVKPVGYSASVTSNVQDVSVTFVAMRSDGKEVIVDNRFLKANNPQLLINFYEQHLRYNPN